MQRSLNARNDVIPLACIILPKQAGSRVPWAVFAIEQPTPVGDERQQYPDWFCQRTGDMGHAGIHRDKMDVCSTFARYADIWLTSCTRCGLPGRGDIPGSIFAGTPIAVKPAGTLSITREFAAIIAPSPTVTAPMILEWHPMKT